MTNGIKKETVYLDEIAGIGYRKKPDGGIELLEVSIADEQHKKIKDGITLEGLWLWERIKRFKEYYEDTDGNKVIFTKRKHFRRVDLYLPKNEYKKYRCIGRVSEKGGEVTYKVQKYYLDHHYRETDSIGFNDTLIHNILNDTDKVIVNLKDTGQKLYTTVETIKKYGSYRRYKGNGLERQIFLSLSSFISK